MTSTQVLDVFTQCGGLLDGHFELSSGLHSPGYLQCALVLQYPDHAARFGAEVAGHVCGWMPQVVLSPALGGLIIGHEVARAIGVRAVFAERRDGRLVLRRGFRLDPGERVLVVEDVITTGKSTRETIDVARDQGGDVVGAAAVINRGGPDVDVSVRFESLAEVSWPTYDPSVCPFCVGGIPITQPGSRHRL
jgi:orotate phosphoribosyltransferase